jgi:enterobactin synthetase component D
MPHSNNFLKNCQFVKFEKLDKLILFRCDFNSSCYRDDLFDILRISFPSALKNSVSKRRAEFLAGRYAASFALHKLGFNSSEIRIGKHRSPVWPDGIVASITHTKNTVVCAAAYERDIHFLGIDLENWLAYETIKEIKSNIILTNEEELLLKSCIGFEKAFTLTFSAKESLFKALYPSVGYYFDFTAAEITHISLRKKTFELILRQNLTPQLTAGTRFSGHFDFDLACIQTLIAEL